MVNLNGCSASRERGSAVAVDRTSVVNPSSVRHSVEVRGAARQAVDGNVGIELLGRQHPAVAGRDLGDQVANLGLGGGSQRGAGAVVHEDAATVRVSRHLSGEPQLGGGVGAVAHPSVGHHQRRILRVGEATER
jgi:hypothetical protein